ASAVARRTVAAVVARAGDVDAGRGRGDGLVGLVAAGGDAEQECAGCGGAEEAAGHGCAFRECVRSPTRYPGIVQPRTDSVRLWTNSATERRCRLRRIQHRTRMRAGLHPRLPPFRDLG